MKDTDVVMENLEVTLNRDCKATLIPAGHEVLLTEGTAVHIAQALGGNLTVRNDMGMYRIGSADLDALGEEVAEQINSQNVTNDLADRSFSEDSIWQALKTCYDPEIPVNIVDLGLIYDLSSETMASGNNSVRVKMTLTAQGCGMGPAIAADAKDKIEAIPEVESAEVEIVWDPQWTPHMISEEGRKLLGLD